MAAMKRALVLCLCLAAAACGQRSAGASAQRPPAPVKVVTIESVPVEETSEYVATVRSRNSAVLQPLVEGHVKAIFVKAGDQVKQGTPLLQIDPMRQQAALSSASAAQGVAKADLERAKATLASLQASRSGKQATAQLADQQYQRSKALRESGAVSQADLDNAKAALDAARADLQSLDAQIQAQQAAIASANETLGREQAVTQEQAVQLRYYRIEAPFDGVVGDIPVKVGDYVSPQTVLTTVDQNTGLEAYVYVPVEQMNKLHEGLLVRLLDNDDQLVADSKVTFVSPEIDPMTQSVLVKTSFDEAKEPIRTLQYLHARVVWSEHPGIRIPVGAVVRLNGQPFAFVLKEGTPPLAQQKPITTGSIVGDKVTVTRGLEPGQTLVVSGVQRLVDGAPVAIEK